MVVLLSLKGRNLPEKAFLLGKISTANVFFFPLFFLQGLADLNGKLLSGVNVASGCSVGGGSSDTWYAQVVQLVFYEP